LRVRTQDRLDLDDRRARQDRGERKADAMARVAGNADYLEMQGQFTDIMLLDHELGRGMPHLAQRVALADAFLRQRHPLDDQNKTWKQVAQNKIGWDYSGQAAYGATANEIGEKGIVNNHAVGPHMHSAGLALDIDDGSGWAFAQASFDRPHPGRPTLTDRGLVQLFAVPKPDGSWSIVLVQYRRQ
jgi:hypothetical protein